MLTQPITYPVWRRKRKAKLRLQTRSGPVVPRTKRAFPFPLCCFEVEIVFAGGLGIHTDNRCVGTTCYPASYDSKVPMMYTRYLALRIVNRERLITFGGDNELALANTFFSTGKRGV